MSPAESLELATLLRNGSVFIEEDSEDSLMYSWRFESPSGLYVFRRQDTIAGFLFPDETCSEADFRAILEENYSYKEFIAKIYNRKDGGSGIPG